jgi:hypothetical protein
MAQKPTTQPIRGIWISPERLASRPMSGVAWASLFAATRKPCGPPHLDDQEDQANICVMANALVFARTGQLKYQVPVVFAVRAIVESPPYRGRALSLGRKLAAYVISADLIQLHDVDPTLDRAFRARLGDLLTTPTRPGPGNLVECHERRPNNWGTHCGAARAAVAAYLGDRTQLNRVAAVFKGWLGDRASYAGFTYGDLSWQCDPDKPVGINPKGCARGGYSIDGVLPEEERRAGGGFRWPPPREPYVWGGLSGALTTAIILDRAGYDVWNWQDQALLRAFEWLYTVAGFQAEGDDTWQPYVVNFYYRRSFPAPAPARPGKQVGWTDWTHGNG